MYVCMYACMYLCVYLCVCVYVFVFVSSLLHVKRFVMDEYSVSCHCITVVSFIYYSSLLRYEKPFPLYCFVVLLRAETSIIRYPGTCHKEAVKYTSGSCTSYHMCYLKVVVFSVFVAQ